MPELSESTRNELAQHGIHIHLYENRPPLVYIEVEHDKLSGWPHTITTITVKKHENEARFHNTLAIKPNGNLKASLTAVKKNEDDDTTRSVVGRFVDWNK